ncbi:MAG: tRNA (adenosine(37)-N6)-dimethylallyltransferase MiaA [Candidatus Kapabacteria bacterium]|nr:tRNA (adenosine(37)-N6)-dimethylallyltransferase MiaA [Candidatus Kapabacteria bacterium]
MADEKIKLIVLLGPTASGKTALSLHLADYLDLEIISADSRQIYKYLDIGTAKPTPQELSKVKHHFISIIEPDEYYSAGMFAKEASDTIKKINQEGKIPIVVGGSGLYIKALCEGVFEENYDPILKSFVKEKVKKMREQEGIEYLYEQLCLLDPQAAELYPDKNPSRIMRALEHIYITGKEFSTSIKNISESDFEPIYIGLLLDRMTLYKRINERTELMWKSGLLQETEKILNMGYSPDLNSLNTVGYKECISLIKGELNEQTAIEKIKQHTRNYAKRQMTWFRKIPNVNWLDFDENLQNKAYSIIKKALNL